MVWRSRTCKRCEKIEWTASKSLFCQLCYAANKRDVCLQEEPRIIEQRGYKLLSGPEVDKFGHRVYRMLTPCGHEWEVVYNNFIKQTSNSKEKGLPPACGVCGPKHRMKAALEGFMDKYAKDYDLDAFDDFRQKVRGLSEVTYKLQKESLNPKKLPRGRHLYHLDHKVPIIECFKRGWTPEQAASVQNLQLLWWEDNLSKGSAVY